MYKCYVATSHSEKRRREKENKWPTICSFAKNATNAKPVLSNNWIKRPISNRANNTSAWTVAS